MKCNLLIITSLILSLGSPAETAKADLLTRPDGKSLRFPQKAPESLEKHCQGIGSELNREDQAIEMKRNCLVPFGGSAHPLAIKASEDRKIFSFGYRNLLFSRVVVTPNPKKTAVTFVDENVISGEATGLEEIAAIATDSANEEIFVLQAEPSRISVFNAHHDGNVKPVRQITASVEGAVALEVDAVKDELWVVNPARNEIQVLRRIAQAGSPQERHSQAPLRAILGGEKPAWKSIQAVAVAPAREEVFVLDKAGNQILVFKRDAEGAAPPLRLIAGDAVGFSAPEALGYSANDDVLEVYDGDGRILRIPAGAK